MSQSAIYTIGTSNRTFDEFSTALQSRSVTRLVDVRSRPTSRLPYFRGASMSTRLAGDGIQYEWLGDVLGGLNEIPTHAPAFVGALDRLIAFANEAPVAIFCAEGDPAHCHRTWKVAAALLVRSGVGAISITRRDQDEPVSDSLRRVRPSDIPECLRSDVLRYLGADGV